MASAGLRALLGLICALSLGGSAVSSARPRPRPTSPPQAPVVWQVVSPDHRHCLELTSSGRLRLDGQLVTATGRPLGRPAWRRDSRALAFLRQGAAGLQLLVLLLDVDPFKPVVWSLPLPAAAGCRQVFWMAPQRIGVGEQTLVPRLVVSWTTTLV